mgnify:CR=1 FL=1
MATITVAGICGSLREESKSRVALQVALDAAEERGAETDLIDLSDLDLPVYDEDEDDAGDAAELTRRVRDADAIILATPMYHGSYSAPLKNAIDYCGFDEFENKTVGLLAVSGGSFPITALEHLRSVMRALDAWVLPYQAAVPNSSRNVSFDDAGNGSFEDDKLAGRVATLGERVVQYGDIQPDPKSFEGEQNEGGDR